MRLKPKGDRMFVRSPSPPTVSSEDLLERKWLAVASSVVIRTSTVVAVEMDHATSCFTIHAADGKTYTVRMDTPEKVATAWCWAVLTESVRAPLPSEETDE
jgi:hypothetical protein